MLVLKSLHVFFVIAWFAGVFYLPRIFVNLAMVPAGSVAERDRLLLMAGKLYAFMTPIGLLALAFGVWIWLGFGFQGDWLNIKLVLVTLVVLYHGYCGRLLAAFRAGRSHKSHIWFRFFNELPVLVLFAICFLVILKPF